MRFGRIIMNDDEMWEKGLMAYFTLLTNILLQKLRKTTNNTT
jgi:hypothetical protein